MANEKNESKRRAETQVPPEQVPPEIIKLLSTPLENMNFETRALNCFRYFELRRLEDLLKFTKSGGFKNLLYAKGFGKKSLANLKSFLVQHKIINAEDWSYLYNYL